MGGKDVDHINANELDEQSRPMGQKRAKKLK